MNTRKKVVVATGMNLAALTLGGETAGLRALDLVRAGDQEKEMVTTKMTDKLMSVRKKVVETEKGYEFQYSPSDISLLELAYWVVAEGKCCPFFDFHIDLEREGRLLCLRLTGDDGIKGFIRSEFSVAAK